MMMKHRSELWEWSQPKQEVLCDDESGGGLGGGAARSMNDEIVTVAVAAASGAGAVLSKTSRAACANAEASPRMQQCHVRLSEVAALPGEGN